jgi:hypothetical protein
MTSACLAANVSATNGLLYEEIELLKVKVPFIGPSTEGVPAPWEERYPTDAFH